MVIRKSAVLLILLSAVSIGLLVFSAPVVPQAAGMPVKCTPENSRSPMHESGTFSTSDMISEIMLRSAA